MVKRKTTSTNYLNQSYLENKCPLNELLFLLAKRWMTDILFCIEEGNNRFSGIKDELKYISDHILSHRLRSLETAGLVEINRRGQGKTNLYKIKFVVEHQKS